jgi:hypothetical protein
MFDERKYLTYMNDVFLLHVEVVIKNQMFSSIHSRFRLNFVLHDTCYYLTVDD